MNGELKEYTSRQLTESVKRLPLSKQDALTLTNTAWKIAVQYLQKLSPDDYRGPIQIALASLVLAAEELNWTLEKRYELVRSLDNSLFANSVYGEMNRELSLRSP